MPFRSTGFFRTVPGVNGRARTDQKMRPLISNFKGTVTAAVAVMQSSLLHLIRCICYTSFTCQSLTPLSSIPHLPCYLFMSTYSRIRSHILALTSIFPHLNHTCLFCMLISIPNIDVSIHPLTVLMKYLIPVMSYAFNLYITFLTQGKKV